MATSILACCKQLLLASVIQLPGLVLAQEPEVLRVWNRRTIVLNLMPDIDRDGHPELLAGDHLFSPPELAGVLRVLSSSGDLLFEHVGASRLLGMGASSAAVGDVNGDGLSDYMGSGIFGRAQVFSGQDGSLLFAHPAPALAAVALGDVDHDGFDDFLLGSSNRVFFYRGGSFELRQVIVPPAHTASFGEKIVSMGDIDGDAFVDFAVGAPGCCGKANPPGEVFVYSGRECALLYGLVGEADADEFGLTVEAPGDLTGDGFKDLVVGAFQCCFPVSEAGRLYFFDGRTGARLRALDPANGGFSLATEMDEIGDLDGSGFTDVLVSMERLGGRSALAVDGHTHEFIHEYDLGSDPFAGGGHDWNDDGFPDFLVGVFFSRIELHSGAPPGTEVLGQPCGSILGQAPRIGATGIPTLGRNYPLHLTDVPGDVPAILRIGLLANRPGPGQRGCTLLSQPFARFSVTTQKIAPGRGAATIELPIPSNTALQGLRFSAQWTVLDPRGRPLAVTRILRPTIGG